MSALTSQLAWHCPAWLSRGHERQSWWRHHLSQARRQIAAFDKEIIVHLGMAQTEESRVLPEIAPLGGWPSPHYHANEDEAFFVQEGKMSFLCEGLARLGSRRWKIGGTPVMCSLERCRQGLKNSSSGARRNSPEREVRSPNVSKPSDLKTASTSWRPCRSVLAGQLVCSAKLSDQIL